MELHIRGGVHTVHAVRESSSQALGRAGESGAEAAATGARWEPLGGTRRPWPDGVGVETVQRGEKGKESVRASQGVRNSMGDPEEKMVLKLKGKTGG